MAESTTAWVPPTLSSTSVFEMQLLGNGSCAWPAGTSSNITQIADATTVQCLDACLALDGCVAASVDGSTCELHTNSASGLYRAASSSAFCYEKEAHSTSLSSSSAVRATACRLITDSHLFGCIYNQMIDPCEEGR